MRIEAILPPARQGARAQLVFEGGETLRVVPTVVAELGLYPGMELDAAASARLRSAAGRASARARAVRIISVTSLSERELLRRLTQKGETPEDAEAAVAWLKELRLLDDGETARQLVQGAVRKGYGEGRIRQLLYEKRVPRELWDEALAQIPDMSDEIDRFLQKKLGGDAADPKKRQQAAAALARRGYDWPQIRAGLNRYGAEPDETEE